MTAAAVQTVFGGYYSTPALPVINTNHVVSILTYGCAVGDGVTTNTDGDPSNAINAAAAGGTTNGVAGGTVELPAGNLFERLQSR